MNLRKIAGFLALCMLLLSLTACKSSQTEEKAASVASKSSAAEVSVSRESAEQEKTNESEQVLAQEKTGSESSQELSLSNFSDEQIEYARVWLMLGVHQEIDELNVTKILAGTAINPNDETSADYPIDVIQLAGSRLIDGSVTYSSNGDGTVKVYQVPLRWETITPEDMPSDYMHEYTQSLIDDAQTVEIAVGDTAEVIKLIKLLNIHE